MSERVYLYHWSITYFGGQIGGTPTLTFTSGTLELSGLIGNRESYKIAVKMILASCTPEARNGTITSLSLLGASD